VSTLPRKLKSPLHLIIVNSWRRMEF